MGIEKNTPLPHIVAGVDLNLFSEEQRRELIETSQEFLSLLQTGTTGIRVGKGGLWVPERKDWETIKIVPAKSLIATPLMPFLIEYAWFLQGHGFEVDMQEKVENEHIKYIAELCLGIVTLPKRSKRKLEIGADIKVEQAAQAVVNDLQPEESDRMLSCEYLDEKTFLNDFLSSLELPVVFLRMQEDGKIRLLKNEKSSLYRKNAKARLRALESFVDTLCAKYKCTGDLQKKSLEQRAIEAAIIHILFKFKRRTVVDSSMFDKIESLLRDFRRAGLIVIEGISKESSARETDRKLLSVHGGIKKGLENREEQPIKPLLTRQLSKNDQFKKFDLTLLKELGYIDPKKTFSWIVHELDQVGVKVSSQMVVIDIAIELWNISDGDYAHLSTRKIFSLIQKMFGNVRQELYSGDTHKRFFIKELRYSRITKPGRNG